MILNSSSCWSRSKSRSWLTAYFMSNVNADLHKAVSEADLDVLRAVADYGAWMECTLADDPSRNTALHKAVLACTDYKDYVIEAKRLKIKKNKETMEYGTQSGWKKLCETEYQVEKLKDEVQIWRNNRIKEAAVIGYLCLARADPRLVNADGMTALEMCDGKHPEILDQMMRQQADLELRERLAEAWQTVHKHAEGMSTTTGLFIRDKYFMRGVAHKMQKMKEHDQHQKDEKASMDSALEKRPSV